MHDATELLAEARALRAGKMTGERDNQPDVSQTKDEVRAHAEGRRLGRRVRKALHAAADVEAQKRTRALLPSAREVFAARIRDVDGNTVPWPHCETREDARALMDRRLAAIGRR